jgi:glucan 1,4-alpha-glucosidase
MGLSLNKTCMIKKLLLFVVVLLAGVLQICAQTYTIYSPGKQLILKATVNAQGVPVYELKYKEKPVIQPSALGFVLANKDTLQSNFTVLAVDTLVSNTSWKPVLGEVKEIKNHFQLLRLQLQEKTGAKRQLNITFKLFDDGLAFRYEFPTQKNLQHFIVTDELTQFQLNGNHKTFWIPGDYDSNEYPYTTSLLSQIDAVAKSNEHTEIAVRSVPDKHGVQTPLMMKTNEGLYINIHEAALVNYPAMQLHIDTARFCLTSSLVPDAVGNKAYLQTSFSTPWRTIIVSDDAKDILASKLIVNVNEPTSLTNTGWIKPAKVVGIWWEMHVSKSTWDYAGSQDMGSWENLSNLKPTGKHGATTTNTKKYIDFAATHGFDGVLVEGWNTGWEDWFGKWKENVFDFVTPYPDFNVKELTAYAKQKGVQLIMHHETSGSVTNYERWMDTAYRFMKRFNYQSVKTGYVGKIIPRGEHHDGQWMINHYNRVAQKTAEYKIMVDMHEPVRPTGMHRTYPNWISNEAARGNEFNAWSQGNPPEHETILPFTRLMGGPMDYTPGIFQIKLNKYGKNENYVHTTLAKQLALYVTMYSPFHMAADLPENYLEKPDAFQFIKDVALDWDDTQILEAEPGDYITIARKEKNKQNWFVGSITDENSRTSTINLSFLTPGKKYTAVIYKDADDAHWDTNPTTYSIEKVTVTSQTQLSIKLAEGGGYAISIKPIN